MLFCRSLILVACLQFISFALAEKGRFVIKSVENPAYHGNEIFRAYETYYSPRIKQLRERYSLDRIVANERDEWRRILLLRHWIKSKIRIENVPSNGYTRRYVFDP